MLFQEGLRLNLGNALFNDYRRRLRFEGGEVALVAGEAPDPRLEGNGSRWLVVDDLLGAELLDDAAEPWTVRTFPQRNATDMSAWYAVLCRPLHSGPRQFPGGAIVQQSCVRMVANPAEGDWRSGGACHWETDDRAGQEPAPRLRVRMAGMDGITYRIIADWGARVVEVIPGG
ncbi:MAG: hypothetical protein HY332_18860 [Chloroflexi bacterium]|nr:hypothetical protein [Chloroflexota bacterium]